MLIGNKVDLVEESQEARKVKIDIVNEFVQKNNLLYFETSAKTGYNIKESFEFLIESNGKAKIQLRVFVFLAC